MIQQSIMNEQDLSEYGAISKGRAFYLKALKIREKVLGEEHPHTATSYGNLAGLYEIMGENKKAEPLYITSFKDKRENI